MSDSKASLSGNETTISLTVNGDPVKTGAETLAALLDELGYDVETVATALDGAFIAAAHRRSTKLSSGAKIEIVAPRQGG